MGVALVLLRIITAPCSGVLSRGRGAHLHPKRGTRTGLGGRWGGPEVLDQGSLAATFCCREGLELKSKFIEWADYATLDRRVLSSSPTWSMEPT